MELWRCLAGVFRVAQTSLCCLDRSANIMLRPRLVTFMLVAAGSTAGIATVATRSGQPVIHLASSVTQPHRPTTVLIHGLDSSKQTWGTVLAHLHAEGYPAIAFDLRGHGESPLGDPADFAPRQLANDVLVAAAQTGPGPFVIVGHSMGGRIAMRLAADHPDRIAALVIEDMDVAVKKGAPELPPGSASIDALGRFRLDSGRRFPSYDAAVASLGLFYETERLAGWKGQRLRPLPGGGWWSDINPVAMRLGRDTVLASTDGAAAWAAIAAELRSRKRFPVHLWVADPKETVCVLGDQEEGSIPAMARGMPSAVLRNFPGAGHSVHNTTRGEFLEALKCVVDEVAVGCQAAA